jgi:hypothetical protein
VQEEEFRAKAPSQRFGVVGGRHRALGKIHWKQNLGEGLHGTSFGRRGKRRPDTIRIIPVGAIGRSAPAERAFSKSGDDDAMDLE